MSSRAQKRPEILRAAAIAFAEVGYYAATTADIAAAIGMSPGNIYYHIQSKEQLLFDVLMDAMRFGLGIIQSVRKTHKKSPAKQLFQAIYQTMVAACQRKHPGMLLFFFTREHRTALTPEHWRRYVARVTSTSNTFVKCYATASQQDNLKKLTSFLRRGSS
jgi:AcrR family transcriptional regulator